MGEFHSSAYFINRKSYHAPRQSLLQKWLREEHKIDVAIIHRPHSQKYTYRITGKWEDKNNGILYNGWSKSFDIYEQSLEEGLKKALELI